MLMEIDYTKTIDANAVAYFEKSKKAKRKIQGALDTIEKTKSKLKRLEKKKPVLVEQKVARKKEWFEKFRWFFASNGMHVIGGRDATTNEIVIKKHTEKNDLVFHTDMAGSPFFVLKTEGKEVGDEILEEVADATATFSRAWKLGLQSQDVFYVKPDQVSKTPESGEHLSKGAFVIRGKTTYVRNRVNVAIGLRDGVLMAASVNTIKAQCGKDFIELLQGDTKVSDIAKKIQHKLGGEIDEIIRILPSGGFSFK